MRIKIIGGIIGLLSLALTVLLFIPNEETTKILISPKIYSIVKSSDNERINITLLVNDSDSYYFNSAYISNISLSSDDEQIIPLVINSIDKSNDLYIHDNEMYYFTTLLLEVGFNSDDYSIKLEKAYLEISYSNSKEIRLYIGEFQYLFSEYENRDFSLNNLLSTHLIINDIDTSSGLFLNLGNLTENNIIIKKIKIGSSNVVANNYYLREVFEEITIEEIPENILGIDNYDYSSYRGDVNKDILLRKNNEIMLYVPLSYIGEIQYLYRFYVEVTYIINTTEKTFVIDDFPYINTSSYKTELEDGYVYYEFKNWNN